MAKESPVASAVGGVPDQRVDDDLRCVRRPLLDILAMPLDREVGLEGRLQVDGKHF